MTVYVDDMAAAFGRMKMPRCRCRLPSTLPAAT